MITKNKIICIIITILLLMFSVNILNVKATAPEQTDTSVETTLTDVAPESSEEVAPNTDEITEENLNIEQTNVIEENTSETSAVDRKSVV